MIYAFILRAFLFIFALYGVMAVIISVRDLMIRKGSILWLSLIGVALGALTLLFATSYLPATAFIYTLLVSVPIFITDKYRNWDVLDRVFRWVSLATVIAALFLFVNYYFLR